MDSSRGFVMPCSVAVGYQRFGGTCCLHLQVEMNAAGKKGLYMHMLKLSRGCLHGVVLS